MNLNDILDSHSPEMRELYQTIEKVRSIIDNHVEKNKPSLLGEQFLDNNEVCEMLHLSSRTLQDYRDKGMIAFYKLEGKILYKMSDIQQMLEKNYFDAWKQKK
ncbi:hypothetical protein EZS27_011262 [termite gut metagenome]|uniref:Helix-turn-helix domain-containing protein n=1 Tax=termite gut metagenome TaxID=433724 RepID=A0A5J4S601_9ZZZZ